MGKITVDKEFLKGYKILKLVFENCEMYEIAAENILDIFCEAEPCGGEKDQYSSAKGYIKIAASAANTAESFALKNNEIGTEWDHRLKERLQMCGGCADIVSFSLNGDDRNVNIDVPYNPLEGILHGTEIEYTNCPSFELDGDGNMIISFGEYSKQPNRTDNDYPALVAGWGDTFGEYRPPVLKVCMQSFSTFGNNINAYFKICDKTCKKKYASFMFIDCRDIVVETFFPKKGDCEIVMSKMADGCIYVGFDGLGVEFFCTSVSEYYYYFNTAKKQQA